MINDCLKKVTNLTYISSQRDKHRNTFLESLRQFYDIPGIISFQASLVIGQQQASSKINILRNTRSFAEFISARNSAGEIIRGGNAIFVRALNIRAKLFCKSKLATWGVGGRRRFYGHYIRHGPDVKLLLVAASLLALMLPRETVYISYGTKARMSVMSRSV